MQLKNTGDVAREVKTYLISGEECKQDTWRILVHFDKDSPLALSQNSILQVLISSIVEKQEYVK